LGGAATDFLAVGFRFAGVGFAAEFVRLAAGRLAAGATAREDLDLPALPTAIFEIFFAGFALAFFGTAGFAGLDFFAFFAGATIGFAVRAFAETATGLATRAFAGFEGLAGTSSAFLRFGAVSATGADVVVLALVFAFMLGWSAFLMQLNERAACRSSTTTERLDASPSFKMQTTLAAFCFTHFARLCFFISVRIESVSPKQIAR